MSASDNGRSLPSNLAILRELAMVAAAFDRYEVRDLLSYARPFLEYLEAPIERLIDLGRRVPGGDEPFNMFDPVGRRALCPIAQGSRASDPVRGGGEGTPQ